MMPIACTLKFLFALLTDSTGIAAQTAEAEEEDEDEE